MSHACRRGSVKSSFISCFICDYVVVQTTCVLGATSWRYYCYHFLFCYFDLHQTILQCTGLLPNQLVATALTVTTVNEYPLLCRENPQTHLTSQSCKNRVLMRLNEARGYSGGSKAWPLPCLTPVLASYQKFPRRQPLLSMHIMFCRRSSSCRGRQLTQSRSSRCLLDRRFCLLYNLHRTSLLHYPAAARLSSVTLHLKLTSCQDFSECEDCHMPS